MNKVIAELYRAYKAGKLTQDEYFEKYCEIKGINLKGSILENPA